MELRDLYRRKKIPWLSIVLTILCVVASILVYIKPLYYDYFSLFAKENKPWQYISFLFVHGITPRNAMWIHLGMNLVGLLPLGILCEKMLGTIRTLVIILIEWGVTIGVFYLAKGYNIVGISTIVYAFAAISFVCFVKAVRMEGKKVFRQPLSYYFIFEFVGILSTFNPIIMSGVSMIEHLSGIVVGFLFAWIFRGKLHRSLETCEHA